MIYPKYEDILLTCKKVFLDKYDDYGTSWRVMRMSSITDQIFIKTQRIQCIDNCGNKDSLYDDVIGIINYSIIALIQLQLTKEDPIHLSKQYVEDKYNNIVQEVTNLYASKNNDYNSIWKNMRPSSIIDIILMKIMRIKKIEDNNGIVNHSENVSGSYFDIINYAFFYISLIIGHESVITEL